MSGPFVDAEGELRDWIKNVSGIVGAGKALTNGAHIGQVSSPANGTVAELTLVGGGTDRSGWLHQPRISASVYGPNRAASNAAAVALANSLQALNAAPVNGTLARIIGAFNITILWAPDGTHARHLVDAELLIGAL